MARSVGEAAAQGLESGFRLAMGASQAQRQNERQDRQDALALEDRARTQLHEDTQQQLGALDAQGRMLSNEGASLATTNPDQATQEDFASRVAKFTRAKGDILSNISGYDLRAQQARSVDTFNKLMAGDTSNLAPGDFTRLATVSTRRPPTDYVRANDQPSVVEQAGEDFIRGMEAKDEPTMLKGVNVMFAPELRVGVGTDSKHGKIVGKEIVGLDPVPGGNPEDPHVVPRIRVYVNTGKEIRGPLPPGMPEGANAYYDAPLTKERSSDPDDPIKPIGVQEALDYMDKQGQMVELMNKPESLQLLQQDADAPDFNPNDYLTALAQVGAAGGKKSTAYHSVPAGGSLVATTTDAKGNVVGERRIEGNPKPASGSKGALQQKLDAIDGQGPDGTGLLTEAEVASKKKDLLGKETTRAPRSSGGGGGSGGSKGGNIQSTKVDGEGYVVGVFRDGSSKRLLIDGKPWKSQDLEKRIDKVAHDLGQGLNGLGKSPKELREEARATIISNAEAAPAAKPKTIDKLPEGAKQIGTSGGKPVYQTPDGKKFRGE